MLRPYGEINKLPKELIDSVPKLEAGKLAIFRVLNKITDHNPQTDVVEEMACVLPVVFSDLIRYENKNYPIGIVKSVDNNGQITFKHKIFGHGEKFEGTITFAGANFEDEEMYMFFMLSNLNKDNKNRNAGVAPKWELVDDVRDSKNERKRRLKVADALNTAVALSLQEVKEFVLSLNESEFQDEETLRNIVEEYAQNDPDSFLQSFGNPAFKLKSVIKRAADRGFIMYDTLAKKVKRTDAKGTTIAILDANAQDWVSSFAEYCSASAKGDDIIKELRKKVKESAINAASADADEATA